MTKLSVVIPAYNAADTIGAAVIPFFEHDSSDIEVIVVDDGSADATVTKLTQMRARFADLTFVCAPQNRGPGAARNLGLDQANGQYVLFFDADDVPLVANIMETIALMDRSAADMAVMTYKTAQSRDLTQTTDMLAEDEAIFGDILNGSSFRFFDIGHYPSVLRTVNFPWNKIFRSAFLAAHTIRFPELRLHEDIRPCWEGLLKAEMIVISGKSVGYHIVPPTAPNMTNQRSVVRLQAFDALKSVNDLLVAQQSSIEVYREFLLFAIGLLRWVKKNIPTNNLAAYRTGVAAVFAQVDKSALERLFDADEGFIPLFDAALMELQS